ncbi:AzlC family ABC transporter permease [Acidihalobacter aeolianus]|uniref:AzlC family ABC transporter permease n=1 Tax=Acidihalobacter aeolianus TaxID=2792603 RepID=UPI0012E9F197|nr:AzlC family ABC transporter permease [Acidihalobacter aeolianus]
MRVLRDGFAASVPIAAGYLPVAVAFGVAGQASGLPYWSLAFVSAVVYAGASQFALLATLSLGAAPLSAALLALILNLRHFVYGPALSRQLAGLNRRSRAGIAFGLTDETFAAAYGRLSASASAKMRRDWLVGLEIGAYLAWQGGTTLGALGGAGMLAWSPLFKPVLDFALPLLFVLLLPPLLGQARMRAASTAGALTALALQWQGESAAALVAAAVAGMAAAWLARVR